MHPKINGHADSVVSPAPKGEDAGKLLDALSTLASINGFYELKRARSGGIDFS